MGMTEKEFKKEIKSQAKSVVKEELIIFDIADKRGNRSIKGRLREIHQGNS